MSVMSGARLLHARHGYETWLVWDESARVFTVYADPDGIGYIGEFDTRREALTYATEWVAEQIGYYADGRSAL